MTWCAAHIEIATQETRRERLEGLGMFQGRVRILGLKRHGELGHPALGTADPDRDLRSNPHAATRSQARADCTDEEWTQVLEELPFGRRHANRLIQISLDSRLETHVSRLPSDTLTLYQLTRLSDGRFEKLIESAVISPSMKRSDASAETRKEKKEEDEKRILELEVVPGKHRAIAIDPPWDYEWLSLAGRAAPGYATMSQDELLAVNVAG